MHLIPGAFNAERGATLIVALIFLLIITMVSLSGVQTTAMEERMASNVRQRNLAFQSSEAGLREAEQFINALVSTGAFGVTPGLLAENDAEPDYFSAATWTDANSIQVTSGAIGTLHGVGEYPRYIIKYVVENAADPNDELEFNVDEAGDRVTIFKIVSQGTGGNGTTQVVLQTNYGKRF